MDGRSVFVQLLAVSPGPSLGHTLVRMARRVRREIVADVDRLRRFVRTGLALEESSLIKRGAPTQLKFAWHRGGPPTWTSTEPTREALDALVIRLRPFVLDDDPAHLFSVMAICQASLRSDAMRAFLLDVRAEWSASQKRGALGLTFNERVMRPDRVARLWLNGYWFHPNGPEREELDAMIGPAQLLTRHMFLDYVYGAAEAAIATVDVVKIGLEQDLFDR